MAEIKDYFAQKSGITALPAILMKFQRIKKILAAAVNLKREPRESDDDLLPAVRPAETAADGNAFQDPVFVPPDLTAQEAALDEREEQLVLWAQALTEQDAALKQKENVLFEEERRQALSQEKSRLLWRVWANRKNCKPIWKIIWRKPVWRCRTVRKNWRIRKASRNKRCICWKQK